MTQTRRSGPGGQHRNKVSTAIVLTHRPSGIVAEASERRTQTDNRRVAIRRLREHLALELRCTLEAHAANRSYIANLRRRYGGGPLRIALANADRPAVLALLLDDLCEAEGRVSVVAEVWYTSSSQVIRFLQQTPEAFALVNAWRASAGQRPLK